MRKVTIEGRLCVGPTFSRAEMAVMKRNLSQQTSLLHLADLLGAVGSVVRLRIVYLLAIHREMCVCDLAEVLGLTMSATSQHLRRLKDQQLVQTRREAQTIYYSLRNNLFNKQLRRIMEVDKEIHELVS